MKSSKKGFLMVEAISSIIVLSIATSVVFYIFFNAAISTKKRETYIDELYILKSSYSIFDNNPAELNTYLIENYKTKITLDFIEFIDYPDLKFQIYQNNNVYKVDVYLHNKVFKWSRLIYE